LLHPGEAKESRHVPVLELHENVDVAVVPKVVAQDGAEQRKFRNLVLAAELGELATGK
jgi:hypothetical protein